MVVAHRAKCSCVEFGLRQTAGMRRSGQLASMRCMPSLSLDIAFLCPTRCSTMSIEISCPGCSRLLRVAVEHAGKQTRCPACDSVFAIPLTGSAVGVPPQPSDNPFAASATSVLGEGTAAAANHENLLPHRGNLVLVMGILSWFICAIFGFIACYVGRQDLKLIRAGQMDPSGLGLTQAGYWLGMASVVLHLLMIGLVLFFLVLGMLAQGGL